MKHTLFSTMTFAGLAAAFAVHAQAADYTVDKSHSNVGFAIKHMVSKVKGQFDDFSGVFSFDPAKPEAAKGSFVVKTASINTSDKKRDEHLRSADFFDVKKHPEMTFSNLKVTRNGGESKYKMAGDLTLHGVTKPVSLDLEYNGTSKDPWGNTRAGFTATGLINREDFNIVWNKTLETGGLLLGKEVPIELQIEAVEGKPAEAKAEAKAAAKQESKKSGSKK